MKVINSISDIISVFCENNKILLYGTGGIANHLMIFLREYGLFDTDSLLFIVSPGKKKSDTFKGYKVLYSDNENIDRNLPVIIAVGKAYTIEIATYLKQLNYNNVYIFNESLFENRTVSSIAYKVRTMLNFQINLTEHCDLNCAMCQHFSPLAKTEFLDLEEYEKDLSCLSKLFCSTAEIIFLVGGEPLLHPNINKVMELTRKYFKFGIICIVTNGVLLPQMNDSFWKSCNKYSVKIAPTPYPLKIDYEQVRKKATMTGVDLEFYKWGGGENG